MPDEQGQVTQTGDQGTQTQPLGWRAGLPDELKNHEVFTPHKTVGDLGKVHIEVLGKLKELEGKTVQMEGALKTAIPRLPENPTKEQIDAFQSAIGRPAKPEEYEFDKMEGVEHSEAFIKEAQKWFFDAGVPKEAARKIGKMWDLYMKGQVDQETAEEQKLTESNQKAFRAEFKTEEEYKAGYELSKRFWNKITGTDFDKAYAEADAWQVPMVMKFIFNVAKLTGEDKMPQGASVVGGTEKSIGMIYDKTPQLKK